MIALCFAMLNDITLHISHSSFWYFESKTQQKNRSFCIKKTSSIGFDMFCQSTWALISTQNFYIHEHDVYILWLFAVIVYDTSQIRHAFMGTTTTYNNALIDLLRFFGSVLSVPFLSHSKVSAYYKAKCNTTAASRLIHRTAFFQSSFFSL